jgi:hypothetical protein
MMLRTGSVTFAGRLGQTRKSCGILGSCLFVGGKRLNVNNNADCKLPSQFRSQDMAVETLAIAFLSFAILSGSNCLGGRPS